MSKKWNYVQIAHKVTMATEKMEPEACLKKATPVFTRQIW